MGMGSRPTTMMPQYGGFPQGGSGQQFGTYDPILGFGQASGMGTTYNAPTRYTADYTRFLQSGQPFNPAVMGYNSYGQIFAQPQRPPPSFGKGGGGPRRPPPPTMGGKGGQQVGSPGVPSTGFDPEGYFRNRPVRGPRGDQGSRGTYGGFLDFYTRQKNNPDNYIIKPPPVGDVVGPYTDPTIQTPVGPQRPMDVEYPLDQNIANSPFGQLIGGGLGGMPSGTQVTNPNQFAVSTADLRYDPTTGTYGPSVTRYFENPPPGMMRNPNYNAARAMQDNVPMPGSDDYLSRQAFIPAGRDFGRMAFQEGGQVPPDAASNMDMMLSEAGPANPQSEMAGEYDRLIQMTMQAILGQTENADEIIQMFIDEFGADAFRQLRDAVLKQQVPGAQTEGMVDGNGGGMDDQVMGMIGNQRPVAVSPGEYIVPADVVSGLGDGSSKSGADILDELNQAVRMARTGTTEQPRPLAESIR